jgi:hypothetical protein
VQLILADCPPRGVARRLDSGKQQRDQDADDRYRDHQFNQRKSVFADESIGHDMALKVV